jgi:hypothetical protein
MAFGDYQWEPSKKVCRCGGRYVDHVFKPTGKITACVKIECHCEERKTDMASMWDNDGDKLDGDIQALQSSMKTALDTLQKVALYQKKVVQMAEILGVVGLHLETHPSHPDKIFIRVDMREVARDGNKKIVNWAKYSEVSTEERIYKQWLEEK